MDIEILLKNGRYLRAKDSTELSSSNYGRSRRWRELLAFPNIRDCEPLRAFLDSIGGLGFRAILAQPIGLKEFELSCAANSEWYALLKLRERVVRFQGTDWEGVRAALLAEMVELYLSDTAAVPLGHLLLQRDHDLERLLAMLPIHFTPAPPTAAAATAPPPPNTATATAAASLPLPAEPRCDRATLDGMLAAIDHVLAEEPSAAFRAGPYFARFLQWKMLEQRPVRDDCFRFFRVLGRGAFGEVWACQSKETGRLYACKRISIARAQHKGGIAAAVNERILLESIRSQFIVNVFYSYVTKEHLCLVLSLVSCGDLRFHLNRCTVFPRERVQFYAAQLVLALEDLYKACILFRDLKPENVLLDGRGYLRLSDFGLAIRVPPNKAVVGRVGTPSYMAPEVKSSKYGPACDWFSLGAVIAEMAQGESPFYVRGPDGEAAVRTTPLFRDIVQPDILDLCTHLLHPDPRERLGCAGHRVVRVADVKAHRFFMGVDWDGLRCGTVRAPFIPDAEEVYAEDEVAVETFRAREEPLQPLSARDAELLSYCQGAIPHTWQNEILETVFVALNGVDPPTPDLDPAYHALPLSFFARLNPFRREHAPPKFNAERASLVYRVRQVLALSMEERGEETC